MSGFQNCEAHVKATKDAVKKSFWRKKFSRIDVLNLLMKYLKTGKSIIKPCGKNTCEVAEKFS